MPTKEFKKKRTKRLGELDIPLYTGGPLQTGPLGFNNGEWITYTPNPYANRFAPFNLNQRYGGYGPRGGGGAETEFMGHRGQPLFPYENPRSLALESGRNIKAFKW